MRELFAAITLTLAVPALAGEPADWRPVDAETGKIRDIERLEQLARDFPDSGTVRLRMLQPLVEAGEVERVMETLEWLYDRGYVFSDVAQAQIPKLLEGVDPGRIAERLIAEPEVVAPSYVIETIPAEAMLAESVIADPERGHLYVTTVHSGFLATTDGQGGLVTFEFPGAANLSGIALTPGAGNIWIASGAIDGSENHEASFRGLLEFGSDEGLNRRIKAPQGVNPSDMTIGPDGRIYTSDPIGGGVYAALPGGEVLAELIAPGMLRSPQGLAVSEDNSKLYVSDYRYGIAILDLESREVSRLEADIPLILDGVDGLWRHGNELIAMQNGTSPMRISAFQLSEDGHRVIGSRVLEQANPEWREPLGGSIDGGDLIYVGNGQWDRYVQGELAYEKEPLPTQIRRLPLDAE